MNGLRFLPGQRFDCSGCAKCCRSPWQVAVDEPSRRRILELPIRDGLTVASSGAWVTAKRAGACVFLTERNRCQVHEQLGEAAKPHTCRQFPFLYQDTPDGVYVGISLYCSAAQRNLGRPLADHAADISTLVEQMPAPRRAGKLVLKEGSWLRWPAYLELESHLTGREALVGALLRLSRAPSGELIQVGACLGGPLPEPDPMLTWMETSFVAGLAARLEGCALEAVLEDGPVLAGAVRASQVQTAMAQGSPAFLRAGLERYREALLFRKFLLSGDRPLLENLLVLHLVLRVAEIYAWAHALRDGRLQPGEEDLYAALDRCELDLVTHGQEAFVMSGSFWKFFARRASSDVI